MIAHRYSFQGIYTSHVYVILNLINVLFICMHTANTVNKTYLTKHSLLSELNSNFLNNVANNVYLDSQECC